MDQPIHNKILAFIWSIADDCLRDVFVRGKYRDVILPMFVLRRIDCLPEETKEAVLAEVKFRKDEAGMSAAEATNSLPADIIKDPCVSEFLGLKPKEVFRENDSESAHRSAALHR